jgi:hypothetical protein
MKAQTKFFTAAAVTAIAGLFSAAPAQAITLGPGLIEGDGTHVYFDFIESHGQFRSDWGVYNNTTGTFTTLLGEVQRNDGTMVGATDHLGTCDITVTNCQASFTFLEGNEYAFFLRNTGDGDHQKTVFSANELNPIQGWTEFVDQTKFFTSMSILDDTSYGLGFDQSLTSDLALTASETFMLQNGMSALIAFEDQGLDTSGTGDYFHGDWNDFIVKASVPEPATVLGLGVVAGAMALYGLRKKDKAS